jgi:hypothetical protein
VNSLCDAGQLESSPQSPPLVRGAVNSDTEHSIQKSGKTFFGTIHPRKIARSMQLVGNRPSQESGKQRLHPANALLLIRSESRLTSIDSLGTYAAFASSPALGDLARRESVSILWQKHFGYQGRVFFRAHRVEALSMTDLRS